MVSASNWSHPIKQPLAAGSGSWDAPVVRSADDAVEDADPSWETLRGRPKGLSPSFRPVVRSADDGVEDADPSWETVDLGD